MLTIMGKQVAAARQILGMSRLTFADMCGVSEGTIANLEREISGQPALRSRVRRRLEARGLIFTDGGVVDPASGRIQHYASAITDGRWRARRDGRLVLVTVTSLHRAMRLAEWSARDLAVGSGVHQSTADAWLASSPDVRLRPEHADRLWLAFAALGVLLAD